MTKPFVGQLATFYPHRRPSDDPAVDLSVRGKVRAIWSDSCVSLLLDNGGHPTSVFVFDSKAGHTRPSGFYCVLDQVEAEGDTMVQPRITGYRQLSPAEAALMNEGKALAELCGAYIAKLRANGDIARGPSSLKDSELAPSPLLLDQHWISLGATDLQRGFMAVIRGIAQPTTF